MHQETELVITLASGHTRSNRNLRFEDYNLKEADTLTVCLAADASRQFPDAQLVFFTPDTYLLVLVLAHYHKLCQRTSSSVLLGTVDVGPIWRALLVLAFALSCLLIGKFMKHTRRLTFTFVHCVKFDFSSQLRLARQ